MSAPSSLHWYESAGSGLPVTPPVAVKTVPTRPEAGEMAAEEMTGAVRPSPTRTAGLSRLSSPSELVAVTRTLTAPAAVASWLASVAPGMATPSSSH